MAVTKKHGKTGNKTQDFPKKIAWEKYSFILLALSAYAYAITITAAYGYTAYFSLPSGLINVSIVSNTLLFFNILVEIKMILLLGWPILTPLLILVIIFIIFFWKKLKPWMIASTLFTIAIFGLFASCWMGEISAKTRTQYYTLSEECPAAEPNKFNIVQMADGGTVIVNTVDKATMKLDGGYKVMTINDTPCRIIFTRVGTFQN